MKVTSEKLINLMIVLYKSMYPNDDLIITPNFIFSNNFHNDAIKIYKKFDYNDDYIERIEMRASWNKTAGITIYNKKMSLPPTIVLNNKILQENTILHELTHVSDYYEYAKRNNFLDKSFMDLLNEPNFHCLYLFSEFRAFYRDSMFIESDLNQEVQLRTESLIQEQEISINSQQLETYNYVNIRFCAFFCAYMDKCLNVVEVDELLNAKSENKIHELIKFLYPLRNTNFKELEKHFEKFNKILNSMINKNGI